MKTDIIFTTFIRVCQKFYKIYYKLYYFSSDDYALISQFFKYEVKYTMKPIISFLDVPVIIESYIYFCSFSALFLSRSIFLHFPKEILLPAFTQKLF